MPLPFRKSSSWARAVAALAPLACDGEHASAPAPPACEGVEIIVAASDYSRSLVCGAPGCAEGPRTVGADLGEDPQLAASGGRAFFLARSEDLVFELDPRCGTPIARFGLAPPERPPGARTSNPHDAAAAPDGSVFVVLYNEPRIAIVEDGVVTGGIDLSAYDPDGNPQADAIRIVDVGGVSKAFVSLERLDDAGGLRSTRPSQMLRIDVASRVVEAAVELAGRNPFNPMSELGPFLYLAAPGNFDDAAEDAAGVEQFDTRTSTSRLVVSERDLGGSVAEVAVGEGCAAAIVAGPEPNVNPTALATFDPVTGRVFATANAPALGPTPGYDLQGLAWRGRFLYVGDRRRGPSGYPVHVLERTGDGCELRPTGRTLDLPEKPVALRPAHQDR